jgi:hypothetical protein
MRMLPALFALGLSAGSFPACHADSPHSVTGTSRSQQDARPRVAAPAPVPLVPKEWATDEPEPEPEAPAFDPASVLDDEERRLLAADDATLTKEERVARADAQRKLVMADPEHPLRPVLTRIEAEVASGEARTKAQEAWSGRAAFPDRDDVEEAPPRG